MKTPRVEQLTEVVRALREWQNEGGPMQLHPGDLGWQWRFGAEATASATRIWSQAGRIVAVGQVDPELVRLAMAPSARDDRELAGAMVRDLGQPMQGGSGAEIGSVEARWEGPFPELLLAAGWSPGASWTPLVRVLHGPVEDCGLRVEVVGPELAHVRASIQRNAFVGSTFTDDRWHAMAAGVPYTDARCLVVYEPGGTAVAAATVWSAGRGRPGLLEPLGVHRDYRGRGYGTAIARAAAGALQEMGSSSAAVSTPTTNVAAIATYKSAGFRALPEVRDLRRTA